MHRTTGHWYLNRKIAPKPACYRHVICHEMKAIVLLFDNCDQHSWKWNESKKNVKEQMLLAVQFEQLEWHSVAETVKSIFELLQFKTNKPKTCLLYGYCITLDIDQRAKITCSLTTVKRYPRNTRANVCGFFHRRIQCERNQLIVVVSGRSERKMIMILS